MQSLIKTCALPIVLLSLTACGGGGGDSSTPSSTPVSSAAPSSTPTSSSAVSSSSASAVTESTQTPVDYTSYSVATIDNCGQGIALETKTFSLFADYDGGVQNQSLSSLNITGWNHTTNGVTAEWTNLKLAGSNYNFSTSAKVNSSCNDVDTLDMVLVKKIADWEHQHANGFERNILSYGYKFGDIENLVVDIKINSAKTSIPDVASLKTTYAGYVDAATVEALDEGKVNVDITFHDGGNLYGKINIQLDQDTLKDKWVRVTVPMIKVKYYEQIGYADPTTKTITDMNNVVIKRMLVVAETKKGAVLRGAIANWSEATPPPETFKEEDLSFKKIEFQLK